MAWPSLQDYNEAVQSPRIVFNDPALQGGVPESTKLGLPKVITGNFACVYRLRATKAEWAVRCFHRRYADQRDRYAAVSSVLKRRRLPYTVGFGYQQRGIRIRGQWYPILKMEWVRGVLLNNWVEANLSKPKAIEALAVEWLAMVRALSEAGIAHGDFQHGNIIVVDGRKRPQLRLVDYDGMFVPALRGMRSNETGHPNFQHPHRMASHFGPRLDHFASWVVYLSLRALSVDPTLWEKTTRGDEALLFKKKDFEFPAQSRTFALLKLVKDKKVRALADKFRKVVRVPLSQVPSLDVLTPKKRWSKPITLAMRAIVQPLLGKAQASAPPASAARKVSPAPKATPAAPPPPKPAPKPPVKAPPWAVPPAAPKVRPTPAKRQARPRAKPSGRSSLVGRAARGTARGMYAGVRGIFIGLWWVVKTLARGSYYTVRAIFWRGPKRFVVATRKRYRRLSRPWRRRVVISAALIVVASGAGAGGWVYLGGPAEFLRAAWLPWNPAGLPGPNEETCEFLARPAAKLYIDGEFVAGEIPPRYRTALAVGRHEIEFVDSDGQRHRKTIRVVKGRPMRWYLGADGGIGSRKIPPEDE